MNNGDTVREFESALAEYCGASHAVVAANGTVTLQAALVALGVNPGDWVAIPPLTMSATTIAVLNVGAEPVFVDVDPDTWLMADDRDAVDVSLGVSLYGLHGRGWTVDDAAQTLRPHNPDAAFTSLSFQASKVLALGEGGALLTNDADLAAAARSYLSLGYEMDATQTRIDRAALKVPGVARHVRYPAINGRMNDLTAARGVEWLHVLLDVHRQCRKEAAALYADAIAGCDWLTPQHVPEGWGHDYWTYAVAVHAPIWTGPAVRLLMESIVKHGGERPYPAWRLAYQEPALTEYGHDGLCPVAEDLQPRLLQFQTNSLVSAQTNATALKRAIEELS